MQPGERLFDVACGNGQFSRQMAAAGVTVVAVDSSSVFLERAQAHTQNAGTEIAQRIRYDQVDATDEEALLAVGEEALFDAAVCNNALMDMAEIKPLFSALFKLLRPMDVLSFRCRTLVLMARAHAALHMRKMWMDGFKRSMRCRYRVI